MPRRANVPAKKDANELAAAALADYAGTGMETVTADDLLIPRIAILQKLSPQLNKANAAYIPGADEGMICDTGMGTVFEEIEFLPCVYRKQWIEWKMPRGSGGIVTIYNSSRVLAQCEWVETPNGGTVARMPTGNVIVETAQMSGLHIVDGSIQQAFISMSGTQLKKCRRWLNIASSEKLARADGTQYTAPLFWRSYLLSSQDETKGENMWKGWALEKGRTIAEIAKDSGMAMDDLVQVALSLHNAISEGHARLGHGGSPEDASGEEI